MSQGFRFEPTTVGHERVVRRARLTQLLNGRFTHRVTTVIGAAGYGKTTALALAVDSNRLDPLGRDAWITVVNDGGGSQFLAGVARSLGADPGADAASTIDRVTDAIWSAAPDDVVIIVDDAHELGTDSLAALSELLRLLPSNGHLVLGSRQRIDIPLARLRAHGQLLEIDEHDLQLDNDEIDALAARTGSGDIVQQLPRHVATADLQLAAGVDAGAEFVWEEVLSALDSDRLTQLRRCSVLEELDDDLVRAVSDGAFDSASLLTGLPLVERFDGGRRMHPILREALTKRLEPGERRKTLSIAAEAEAARGNHAVAVRLHHEAADPIGALDAARGFATAPTMVQTMDAVTSIRRIAAGIDPDAPVVKLLDAFTHFDGLEAQLGERLTAAADAAREAGDTRLETVALHRAAQTQLLHHDESFWSTYERITDLAERDERAGAVRAYLASILHQKAGEPDEAIRNLDELAPLGRSIELSVRAERLYDLARPEQVALGLTAEDLLQMPAGARAFIGISIWVRGDSTPEASLKAVTKSIERAIRARYSHPLVSTLGTGVLIALAAGENSTARRWAELARDEAASVGRTISEIALIARAAVAAVIDGDDTAASILATEGQSYTFSNATLLRWPSRAQLPALALVYLCRPDLRPMLDDCDIGPSIATGRSAGQALVELREDGNIALAAALPWQRHNLLRANVLPPHLVELACAAIAAGNEHARDVLDLVPDARTQLARLSAVDGPAAGVARDILGATPRSEPFRLRALTLGPVVLERDGLAVDTRAFTRRPKVRELFALLLERGTIQRADICSLLWPEHEDEDKALSSLRTTLSTLNDVLEPDRPRGQPAFHLHVDGDTVTLDRRVTTDLDDFEELVAIAQRDDQSGLPARALEEYRAAAELYRGDYLQGVEAPWNVLTRLRLRTLAGTAMCRVAELTAAKGEPEEAARWAIRARELDALNERAGRVFVAALAAAGDRSAARTAADELTRTLRDADLPLSPATTRLLDQLT
jgi:DNA-binding SARP family transcriptional activator